jgi:hypothetical protein
MDPAARSQMPAFDVARYATAIAASLHAIYIVAGLLGLTIFLLTLALPSKHRVDDPA